MCNIQLLCFMSELKEENITLLFPESIMAQWDFLPDKWNLLKIKNYQTLKKSH